MTAIKEQEASLHELSPQQLKENLLIWLENAKERGQIILFPDATPSLNDPLLANLNSIEAAKLFLETETDSDDPIIVIGSMGSGKTTFLLKIVHGLRGEGKDVRVYTHTFDKERSGTKGEIMVQAGESGLKVQVEADYYNRVQDLNDFAKDWKEGEFIVIDEFMFAQEGKEDPPETKSETIQSLLNIAKEKKVKLIISGLHSDFRGIAWPNMWYLMKKVGIIYEFYGRCDTENCNNPSKLTARKTGIVNINGEKINRPSSTNEVVCRVGNVLSNGETALDTYNRACESEKCHKVLTPEEAEKFDRSFGVEENNYYR